MKWAWFPLFLIAFFAFFGAGLDEMFGAVSIWFGPGEPTSEWSAMTYALELELYYRSGWQSPLRLIGGGALAFSGFVLMVGSVAVRVWQVRWPAFIGIVLCLLAIVPALLIELALTMSNRWFTSESWMIALEHYGFESAMLYDLAAVSAYLSMALDSAIAVFLGFSLVVCAVALAMAMPDGEI